MLREKDVLISDEKALATLMDKYFVNIEADLNLKETVKLQPAWVVYWKVFTAIKLFWKFKKPLISLTIFPFMGKVKSEFNKKI